MQRSRNQSLLKNKGLLICQVPDDSNDQTFEKKGKYDDKTDLLAIHEYVVKTLKSQQKKIPKLDALIEEKDKLLAGRSFTVNRRRTLERERNQLIEEKEAILSSQDLKDYTSRSDHLLADWKKIIQKENANTSFGEERRFSADRVIILRLYFRLLMDFDLDINMTLKLDRTGDYCPNCYEECLPDDESLICGQCGYVDNCLMDKVTYNEQGKLNNYSSSYINKETFDEFLDCYEGKQKVKWSLDEMLQEVKEYCQLNDLNWKKLTPIDLVPILRKIGYSDYYKHRILFCHHLNGWEIPSLQGHRHLIDQDYIEFYNAYHLRDDRESAINKDWMLWQLLERRKIPYRRENFKIPETDEILEKTDAIVSKIFQHLDETREPYSVPWTFTSSKTF